MLFYRPQAFSMGGKQRRFKAPDHHGLVRTGHRRGHPQGSSHFICGNAVGVDTWAAQLVLKKKELNPGIVLEVALPFEGHNDHIPLCRAIQKKADIVHVVSRRPDKKAAFSVRNKYMVDSSDMLIGVYNPSHRRGRHRQDHRIRPAAGPRSDRDSRGVDGRAGCWQSRGGTPPAYSILTITVVSSTKTKIDISVLKSYSVYE